MSNVKNMIDELESKINEYRSDCLKLNDCRMNIAKLENEHDNIENGWDYEDEDMVFIRSKLKTAFTDLQWFQEAVELSLFAIKHAAYRLGKMRSVTSAEP